MICIFIKVFTTLQGGSKGGRYERENNLVNIRDSVYYLDGNLDVSSVEDIYKAISPPLATENHYDHYYHFLPASKKRDYKQLAKLPLTNAKIQTRVGSQDDMSELRYII